MSQSKDDEIALLRYTLEELRASLPKCGRPCPRVATYSHYHDEAYCDAHVPGGGVPLSGLEIQPWAPVARRLGW